MCAPKRKKPGVCYVKVKLEDLRHLYRCAQVIQIGLNNRLNAAKGIGGDLEQVAYFEIRHNSVLKMMQDVSKDVESFNGISLMPSTFI